MDDREALRVVDDLVYEKTGKRLNDLQRVILQGTLQGENYKEIYQKISKQYSLEYLSQDVGYKLWRLLSRVFGEKVNKKNLRSAIERALQQNSSHPTETTHPIPTDPRPDFDHINHSWGGINTRQDWRTLPDISRFYGRSRELEQLEQQIRFDGCRLLTIYGMGKVGKTSLAVKLAQRVRDSFQVLIWRSLDSPPDLPNLIADLIQVLSNQQEHSSELSCLLKYLVEHHCLIVLDGYESVLQSGVHDGSYQEKFRAYRELLHLIGKNANARVCLLLTSRENPKDVELMESETDHVCSFRLEGLGEVSVREMFAARGISSTSDQNVRKLVQRYEGNPFALNVIATRIRRVFGGNVTSFLEQQNGAIYPEIRDLLEQQFERLSDLEKIILLSLTNYSEPATFAEILRLVLQPVSSIQLEEVLESLCRRSLVEVNLEHYSLPDLLQEHLVDRCDKSS